jgi:hypothetical protein
MLTDSDISRPSLTIDYQDTCEGQSARIIGYSNNGGGTNIAGYLDAGELVLANGSTRALPGPYLKLPATTIDIANLPASAVSVVAELVVRSQPGFTSLAETTTPVSPQAGSASAMLLAPPGADLLRIKAAGATTSTLQTLTERIVPASSGTAQRFDAATLPPLFDSVIAGDPRALVWTGGGTGGTLVIVVALGGATHWDAFLEASASGVTFPQLPADLAAAIPAGFDFVSVDRLEVPGTTSAELVQTIDAIWTQWPEHPALVPPEGGSRTEIRYRSGAH